MAEASELFNLMPQRNILTWNAIIDGYARNGPEGEALKHLTLMLRSCFRPNETTISTVLTSCKNMLELIQAHALVIRIGLEHHTLPTNALVTMILAYSNHGYDYHALHVFARILRSGTKPDEITFVGVLTACSHTGLVAKGQRLFDSMSCAYGFKPRAEHYSCLVDILGRAGLVDEAMKVVCEMPPSECRGHGMCGMNTMVFAVVTQVF